ncbi:hypothetical protein IFM89_029470 [Coptis chinensis]|uniref:Uncharacterized protein n=1 Tax=Coptis chinensis TaxID=261450 RepID=A0A835HW82_9MAGN|nr:hypothetical protein IFM89_029470 [Coptis chinensis]
MWKLLFRLSYLAPTPWHLVEKSGVSLTVISVMALKALVFLLASFLLVTSSKVSSNEEENFMEATSLTRCPAPVKAPFPKVLPPVKLQECPLLCKGTANCTLGRNIA